MYAGIPHQVHGKQLVAELNVPGATECIRQACWSYEIQCRSQKFEILQLSLMKISALILSHTLLCSSHKIQECIDPCTDKVIASSDSSRWDKHVVCLQSTSHGCINMIKDSDRPLAQHKSDLDGLSATLGSSSSIEHILMHICMKAN